jgi:hypothetical protein
MLNFSADVSASLREPGAGGLLRGGQKLYSLMWNGRMESTTIYRQWLRLIDQVRELHCRSIALASLQGDIQ